MSLPRPTMVMIGSRPSACSEVVRWSGLPRDVYCPEISTKSALFPRFGHKGNRSDHRALIVVRPRNGGVDAQDAMGRRLFVETGQTQERASADVDSDHRPAGLAGPSVLRAAERDPRRSRLRRIRGGAVSVVLRADDGAAEPAPGAVLPVAAPRIFRRCFSVSLSASPLSGKRGPRGVTAHPVTREG